MECDGLVPLRHRLSVCACERLRVWFFPLCREAFSAFRLGGALFFSCMRFFRDAFIRVLARSLYFLSSRKMYERRIDWVATLPVMSSRILGTARATGHHLYRTPNQSTLEDNTRRENGMAALLGIEARLASHSKYV